MATSNPLKPLLRWPSVSNPRVSAIGCVLNLEAWVGETLLSLRRQTFKEFEAIYVDDGSTDTTKRILMHYAQLDPRFK